MRLILLVLLGSFIILFSNNLNGNDTNTIHSLILKVYEAENRGDIRQLKNVFIEDSILINTEGPPIVGKAAIIDFYKYILDRYELNSSYFNNQIKIDKDSAIVHGTYIFELVDKNSGETNKDKSPFNCQLVRKNGTWKISHLIYGNKIAPAARVPNLPKPSGKYTVGMKH